MPGKQFRGFITNDCRVVHAMIAHLEEVRAREAKRADGEGTVRRVLAVTSLYDSPEYAVVRSCAAGLAAADGGEVVVFEKTAASFLVSPYPEENRRQWIRTLGEPELRRMGRSPVGQADGGDQGTRSRGAGDSADVARVQTPGGVGGAGGCGPDPDPGFAGEPGRVRTAARLQPEDAAGHTSRPVLVVYPDGSTWRANHEHPPAEPQRVATALAA